VSAGHDFSVGLQVVDVCATTSGIDAANTAAADDVVKRMVVSDDYTKLFRRIDATLTVDEGKVNAQVFESDCRRYATATGSDGEKSEIADE